MGAFGRKLPNPERLCERNGGELHEFLDQSTITRLDGEAKNTSRGEMSLRTVRWLARRPQPQPALSSTLAPYPFLGSVPPTTSNGTERVCPVPSAIFFPQKETTHPAHLRQHGFPSSSAHPA